MALISRLPLVMDTTVGAGPINGIFQQDGVFNGDTFVLSGNKLYRGAVLLGTITGTGPVSWAMTAPER